MVIGLSRAKHLFQDCQKRGDAGFIIKKHCWQDYPQRSFSQLEVLNLLLGSGTLIDNRFPSAKEGSFIWKCRDSASRNVEIVIVFTENGEVATCTEVKLFTAIAISAHRKGGSES